MPDPKSAPNEGSLALALDVQFPGAPSKDIEERIDQGAVMLAEQPDGGPVGNPGAERFDGAARRNLRDLVHYVGSTIDCDLDFDPHERRKRVVALRRDDVVQHARVQRIVGEKRSFGIALGQRRVAQDHNEQAFEQLGVVNELTENLKRVHHRRRGIANALADRDAGAKDLADVDREAEPFPPAKLQPPAQRPKRGARPL